MPRWLQIVLTFVLFAALKTAAGAADYRPGMNIQEAAEVARSDGYSLIPFGESGYLERRRVADGSYESNRAIGFCDNKLSRIVFNMQGGFEAFAKTASDLEGRFGPGSSSTRFEFVKEGIASEIILQFSGTAGETHYASFTKVGSYQPSAAHRIKYDAVVCQRRN